MADPVSLISSLTRISITLHETIKTFREAKEDIEGLLREITALTDVLARLQTARTSSLLPDDLKNDLANLLQGCNTKAIEAEIHVRKASNRTLRGLNWTLSGKKECLQLCRGLEAYKGTISITLNLSTV
jgi:hypothetical protein